MTRFLLVFALLAFVAVVLWAMRKAWQARVSEQALLSAPAAVTGAPAVAGPWTGKYLGAVFAGHWLDRVAAHTLGARSAVRVSLTEHGIDIVRTGARSFHVAKSDVIGVRADKGIAGRVYEDGGIVVLTFDLGGTPIDIGFRFPDTEDHLAALAALAPEVTS